MFWFSAVIISIFPPVVAIINQDGVGLDISTLPFYPEYLRLVHGTTTTSEAFVIHTVGSLVECGYACVLNDPCDVSTYDSATGICNLHSWNKLTFENPFNPGQNTSTTIIRRDLKLALIRSSGGYEVAESVCHVFGGYITFYSSLQYAYDYQKFHRGECGLIAGGSFYYALQFTVADIGYRGINSCYWMSDGPVYCTIPVRLFTSEAVPK